MVNKQITTPVYYAFLIAVYLLVSANVFSHGETCKKNNVPLALKQAGIFTLTTALLKIENSSETSPKTAKKIKMLASNIARLSAPLFSNRIITYNLIKPIFDTAKKTKKGYIEIPYNNKTLYCIANIDISPLKMLDL